MRLVQATPEQSLFHLGEAEKALFLEVLGLYPRILSARQPLSRQRKVPDPEANQRLLDEALAERRRENQQQLQVWLAESGRFTPLKTGYRLRLTPFEVEWLLEILNEVRVGSWVNLGSPEHLGKPLAAGDPRDFWAMEMSGYFQMCLLAAVEGRA